MQESTHKVQKSAPAVVLSGMQPTLHGTRRTPHGPSCLVHATSAWSVKTRRDVPRPGVAGVRGSIVGLETTATRQMRASPLTHATVSMHHVFGPAWSLTRGALLYPAPKTYLG